MVNLFDTVFEEFVYVRTYSRYLDYYHRRENWTETSDRWLDYVLNPSRYTAPIPEKVRSKIRNGLYSRQTLPSMRLLWSAGSACDSTNVAAYNCSALAIESPLSFGAVLLILMSGAGVGYSVERKYVEKLPTIKLQRNVPVSCMTIEDSKFGWQNALNAGMSLWFEGRDIVFDYSDIRPEGTPLKTFGGRASGPEVLRTMLNSARNIMMSAQGRKLTSLECHDICCLIAKCVIVGGVRRSAMISLSDLDDTEMRDCKTGIFPPERFGANNSAVYYEKPNCLQFMEDFAVMGKSGRGERGIFNLYAARKNAPHRRRSKLIYLVNPCTEVTLRDKEFCNLTTFMIRADDDFHSLLDKVKTATWMGVLQSTFTDFPNLSSTWKENCEDERLCGVSFTGILDNPSRIDAKELELLRKQAIKTAREASELLGINMPAAVSCVKPSGTASAMCDTAAGIHPRWAPYYLRNVQISKTDPLYKLMVAQGAPCRDTPSDESTAIIGFPMKSPDGAITRHDLTALDQLEIYKKVSQNYTEMSTSCTIYVDDSEWIGVAAWVHSNFDSINGLSFFPKNNHAYEWSPYQDISELEYARLNKEFPKIDFGQLPLYEEEDQTMGAKEYACSAAGGCEI